MTADFSSIKPQRLAGNTLWRTKWYVSIFHPATLTQRQPSGGENSLLQMFRDTVIFLQTVRKYPKAYLVILKYD